MSAEPGVPALRGSVSGSLMRGVDPFLDPALAIMASGFALASLLSADVDAVDPRLHGPDVLSAIATVVAAGSLAWRRKRPVASYAVFVAGALLVSASFHYIGLLSLLLLLSLFSLAIHGSRREGLVGLGVGIACFVGLWLAGVPDLRSKDVLLAVALLVASWALAEALRSRREQQLSQVRAAVTEERLRIARELHDLVAHSMSLIAVQAGVGAHVIRTDPAAAEQSLGVIADTSRKALEQTRSMLGMLREESEDGSRPPTYGLDDLPALADDVSIAGLEVSLVSEEAAPGLDVAVSLAAYRIVQESLTNVIKHSTASTATVSVKVSDTRLDIVVRDPGPGRGATVGATVGGTGHGLVGLDERSRLVGGTLDFGADGDGFRVHATLPAAGSR